MWELKLEDVVELSGKYVKQEWETCGLPVVVEQHVEDHWFPNFNI